MGEPARVAHIHLYVYQCKGLDIVSAVGVIQNKSIQFFALFPRAIENRSENALVESFKEPTQSPKGSQRGDQETKQVCSANR